MAFTSIRLSHEHEASRPCARSSTLEKKEFPRRAVETVYTLQREPHLVHTDQLYRLTAMCECVNRARKTKLR